MLDTSDISFCHKAAAAIFFSLLSCSAFGAISAATGFSSVTSGRAIPLLAVGWETNGWAVSGTSTGVRTSLYFHSAWTLSAYRTTKAGELFSGPIVSGFGVGGFYARRGYRENTSAVLDQADDFNFGPAFRVTWQFFGPAFIAVEAMYGLRRPVQLIVLSAQDTANVTIGASF